MNCITFQLPSNSSSSSNTSSKKLYFIISNTNDACIVQQILETNFWKDKSQEWKKEKGKQFGNRKQILQKCSIFWSGSHLKPYIFKLFSPLQKVNHFPNTFQITRKNCLYNNFRKMKDMFGEVFFNYCPISFVLPREWNECKEIWSQKKHKWILKPCLLSRGRGIKVIDVHISWKELQTLVNDQLQQIQTMSTYKQKEDLKEAFILSAYIEKPLLIKNFKFDLRIYVCVTSFYPILTIYMYQEGLCRFASEVYSSNVDTPFAHLTNYSINKKNETTTVQKWSLSQFKSYIETETNHSYRKIEKQIHAIIIKSMLSIQREVVSSLKANMPETFDCCFELFGFDILIDEKLKCWLMEINLSPSLETSTELDYQIKSNLICDVLNLIGVQRHDTVTEPLEQDLVEHLLTSKQRCGNFSLIFPNRKLCKKYAPFLPRNKFLDELLSDERF